MNIRNLQKTSGALFAALFIVTLALVAQASPTESSRLGPREVYRPVTTMAAAQGLPVGSRIAFSCDNGGPVTVVTVDKDRNYLKSFTCPVSKRVYRLSPGGSGHGSDLIYQAKGGYTAHLLSLGKI